MPSRNVPDVITPTGVTYISEDGEAVHRPLEDVAEVLFECVDPVRRPPVYKGQRNFPGFYYSASSNRHLVHESWLERAWLTLIDFAPTTETFSTQPFWLHFRRGTKTHRHAPDVFVREKGGAATVIDIRPSSRAMVDAWRFDATEKICRSVGWTYRVEHEPDEVFLRNVEWLAGYRRPVEAFEKHADDVLSAAYSATTLGALRRVEGPAPLVRATVFHLLWSHLLSADLTRDPLSDATVVVAAR